MNKEPVGGIEDVTESELERAGAEWDELREVEFAAGEDDFREKKLWRENGRRVLAALAAESETTGDFETLKNPKLELMQENWGNFEASRELFADDTKMSEYEYGVIARHYDWDEFAEFADEVYQKGHEGEDYREIVFEAGEKLQHDKEDYLVDWQSFELAVRRYNVAKHFGEMLPEEKFYAKLDASIVEGMLEGRSRGANRVELGYDGDNKTEAERVDPGGNLNVTLVLDQGILQSDGFDPLPKQPMLGELRGINHVEAVLANNVFVQYQLMEANNRNRGGEFSNNKIIKTEDWLAGKRELDGAKFEKEALELWKETFRRVGNKEINKRIDGKVEKFDKGELRDLVQRLKRDPDEGLQEVVNYFGERLGVGDIKAEWGTQNKKTMGESSLDGVKVSAKLRRRPKALLETIAHEVWHQHQAEIARKWRYNELEKGSEEERLGLLYHNNAAGYRGGSQAGDVPNEVAYATQLYEKEAFRFGKQIKKKARRF